MQRKGRRFSNVTKNYLQRKEGRMASILDWSLIIIYMLAMVGVGMYFKTDDSMQDFAVADKKLGLSVMTATMLATAVGGGALTGSVGNSYVNGIVEVPKIIILLCINLFMGLFVAKKMRNIGGFTAPEMLGRVYGKKCQTLGGLFCAIYMMGNVYSLVARCKYETWNDYRYGNYFSVYTFKWNVGSCND